MSHSALPPLAADIPPMFAEMAVLAGRLDATLAVFDSLDRLCYASAAMRRTYWFFDFQNPSTFDDLMRRSWSYARQHGEAAPLSIDEHLAYAKKRRMAERLVFMRLHPVPLLCEHFRLPDGWNIQVRFEPQRAGLAQWFGGSPVTGLMAAIQQREEAEQRAAALDSLALGVAIVTPDQRVLFSNAALDDMVRQGNALRRDDRGRLVAADATADQTLAAMIGRAALGYGTAWPAVLPLSDVAGDRHLVAVTPAAGRREAAVITVVPARMCGAGLVDLLRREFGLTPAEAALAARIGDGETNDAASAALGRSAATGRSQLNAVYQKLTRKNFAVGAQTGLSRLVAGLAAITGAARRRGLN